MLTLFMDLIGLILVAIILVIILYLSFSDRGRKFNLQLANGTNKVTVVGDLPPIEANHYLNKVTQELRLYKNHAPNDDYYILETTNVGKGGFFTRTYTKLTAKTIAEISRLSQL